jgi:hypothetical protein
MDSLPADKPEVSKPVTDKPAADKPEVSKLASDLDTLYVYGITYDYNRHRDGLGCLRYST